MKKIAIFIGTRPEAIKMMPIIKAIKSTGKLHPVVISTGQHEKLLQQVLELFDIKIDTYLKVMRPNQQLAALTARLIVRIENCLQQIQPDMALVQGDTATAFMAALACFYQRIPIGHVEAGLRTNNIWSPFPEEVNRRLIAPLATLNFAPTDVARLNLLRENIEESKIVVTGNTSIDAILLEVEYQALPLIKKQVYQRLTYLLGEHWNTVPFVLITCHRRENFGEGLEQICRAIVLLAQAFPDYNFIYPVHLNPQVQQPVNQYLADLSNVKLIPPVNYREFVALMYNSKLILTDSGGVQEEAPALGKPVLVMRDTTERPEGLKAGATLLAGKDAESIFQNTYRLLTDEEAYRHMSKRINLYGDGQAARRIIKSIQEYFTPITISPYQEPIPNPNRLIVPKLAKNKVNITATTTVAG
jgi:UDP-N-acetylglucosamine 2-epimerase (non-hydrolysing)